MDQSVGSVPESPAQPLLALKGDASSILARIEAGETVKQIADSFGIAHQNLYAFLLRNAPDQWQALSAGRALARYEDAMDKLEQARDRLDLTKADKRIASSQWELERVARKIYGSSDPTQGVAVHVHIDRSCGGLVIDQELAE